MIEFDKNENGRRLEESKEFMDNVMGLMSQQIASIEDAILLSKGDRVHLGWNYWDFDRAVKAAGVSREEYIQEAIKQRLKQDGFLEGCVNCGCYDIKGYARQGAASNDQRQFHRHQDQPKR